MPHQAKRLMMAPLSIEEVRRLAGESGLNEATKTKDGVLSFSSNDNVHHFNVYCDNGTVAKTQLFHGSDASDLEEIFQNKSYRENEDEVEEGGETSDVGSVDNANEQLNAPPPPSPSPAPEPVQVVAAITLSMGGVDFVLTSAADGIAVVDDVDANSMSITNMNSSEVHVNLSNFTGTLCVKRPTTTNPVPMMCLPVSATAESRKRDSPEQLSSSSPAENNEDDIEDSSPPKKKRSKKLPCTYPGCTNQRRSKQVCVRHGAEPSKANRICKHDGCTKSYRGGGYCTEHVSRQ